MDLDKSIIGLSGKSFIFEVEKRHVRQFVEAIGDSNPLYLDEEYAAKTTYGGLIAPPTFPIAVASEGGELPIELDTRRMLHGEQEFIYYQSIRPRDHLHCQMKIADLYERVGKSGSMQFLVLDTEMRDGTGEMVAISQMTIVYRNLAN